MAILALGMQMFSRKHPALQTELHVDAGLSNCVAKLLSAMLSSGFTLVREDRLMHRFSFAGRRGIAEVPGRFVISAYGMGPQTCLVMSVRRGLLSLWFRRPSLYRRDLEAIEFLLRQNLPTRPQEVSG
jgi:hypothetical protein